MIYTECGGNKMRVQWYKHSIMSDILAHEAIDTHRITWQSPK